MLNFSANLLIQNLVCQSIIRVEVPEQISGDQLWFRKYSVLNQRCSSPENLRTSLKISELKISAEQHWITTDFLWNRAEQRWLSLK